MKNGIEKDFENGYDISTYQTLISELREKESVFEKRNTRDKIISDFDGLIRTNYNKNVEDFTQIVIAYVSETTEAFSGIFYLYNEGVKTLKASAGYACNIEKLKQQELSIGEGLVGQAAETKKSIFFNNIAANAIELPTQGNIHFNAGSLLILPLEFNERLFGVLELLFLKPLEEDSIELLKIMGRNTATTLESIINNAITQKLLEDSQKKEEELRVQQEELQHNMEKMDSFILAVNNCDICSVEFDLEGTILNANKSFLKLTGYELEEIIGKKHRIFVDEEYGGSEDYRNFWDNLRKGIPQTGEYKRRTKKNNEVYIHGAYSVLNDKDGMPSKVLKLATDITANKLLFLEVEHNNEELKTQEEELRQNLEELVSTQEVMQQKSMEIENRITAIDNSGIASIEFDLDTTVLWVNEAFLKIFGYDKKEEIVGKKHEIFVEQEYAKSADYQNFWDSLRNGVAQGGEFRQFDKDGKEIHVAGAYSIIRDANGNPSRVFKLVTDITKTKQLLLKSQKQTEGLKEAQLATQKMMNEVQEKESYLNSMINATTDSILTIDHNYKLVYWNEALNKSVEQTGWVMEKGFDTMLFYTEEQKPKFKAYYDRVFQGESFEVMEEFGDENYTVYITITYAPVYNDKKEIVGVGVFSKNITEMILAKKNAENLLATSQKQAEELKTQEEELIQNLEELQTTQDAMNLKQLELEELNAKMKENEADMLENIDAIAATQEEMIRKEKKYLNMIAKLEEDLKKTTSATTISGK